MDVDGATTKTTTEDIEQSFLNQFASICTDDKDNLVGQFQYVLANEPSQATAKFFLDMNNWNIQAAVGCYVDYVSSTRPSMKLLKCHTVGEGEDITPNTSFTASWLVQNNAETEWPAGTCLREISNHGLDHITVHVPQLRHMCTTVVSVTLVSPPNLGEFTTQWRLFTPENIQFGDIIVLSVQVTETGTMSITQQLNQLHTSSTPAIEAPPPPYVQFGPQTQPADDEMWDDYN